MNDQIVNDELIETNEKIISFYRLSGSELAKQKQEVEAFQKEILSNTKGICGGIFGRDQPQSQSQFQPDLNNQTTLELPSNGSNQNSDQTKGGIISNIVNYSNNKPIKPCQIVSGWECRKFGKYPHPSSCQKVSKSIRFPIFEP